MSSYLGFMPTEDPEFYFVSYNNEDAERVGPIAEKMVRSGIPLWYDYGLEYGENWTAQINEKLSKAQAMILFFTKGILEKKDSYVQKEFKIARLFRKKIIVLMLDQINSRDVPVNKADWWIDITDNQCLNLYAMKDTQEIVREIRHALGYPETEKAYDVYISYEHSGIPIVEKICASMEAEGIRCFYSHRDIPRGCPTWAEEAASAIQKSKMMVIVLTEEAMSSKRVMFELMRAQSSKTVILPFMLTDRYPERIWAYHLSSLQCQRAAGKPLSESIPELKHVVRVVLRNC